jgi:hypothetical protein
MNFELLFLGTFMLILNCLLKYTILFMNMIFSKQA